jgi:hypothetical protein
MVALRCALIVIQDRAAGVKAGHRAQDAIISTDSMRLCVLR